MAKYSDKARDNIYKPICEEKEATVKSGSSGKKVTFKKTGRCNLVVTSQ
jgi:hypothetical protein